jgi:hypothetical protein
MVELSPSKRAVALQGTSLAGSECAFAKRLKIKEWFSVM